MILKTIENDTGTGIKVLQARVQDSNAYINVEIPRQYHKAISVIEKYREPFQLYHQVEIPEELRERVREVMEGELEDMTIHLTVPYKGEENKEDALLELKEIKYRLGYFQPLIRRKKEFNEEEAIGDQEGFVEDIYTFELDWFNKLNTASLLRNIEQVSGGQE